MAVLVIAIVTDIALVWATQLALPILELPAVFLGTILMSVLAGCLNIWSIALLRLRLPDLYIVALTMFLFGHALAGAAPTSTDHVLLINLCSIGLKIAQVALLVKAVSSVEADVLQSRQQLVEHFK